MGGTSSNSVRHQVPPISLDTMNEIRRLHRMKYPSKEEKKKLQYLKDITFEFLARKAFHEAGLSYGPTSEDTVIRDLKLLSEAEDKKLTEVSVKYHCGSLSLDESRYIAHISDLVVMRMCCIAKLNFWDFIGHLSPTENEQDNTADDGSGVEEYNWSECSPSPLAVPGKLKRRHKAIKP